MQVHLYDHLQKKLQMTGERLAAIDASASSISSNIRDLSSLLAQLSGLGGLIGAVIRWKWQVLTVLATAWFSRRGAAYAAAVMGSFHLCRLSPVANIDGASLILPDSVTVGSIAF